MPLPHNDGEGVQPPILAVVRPETGGRRRPDQKWEKQKPQQLRCECVVVSLVVALVRARRCGTADTSCTDSAGSETKRLLDEGKQGWFYFRRLSILMVNNRACRIDIEKAFSIFCTQEE